MLALTPAERNGRKTLTTIEGIPSKFDLKKILKVIKKQFACNGTIVNDEKAGDVIQLQGDQRNAVKDFLVDKEKGLEIDSKTIKASLGRFGFTRLTWAGPWLLIDQTPHPATMKARGNGFGQGFGESQCSLDCCQ
jgi:translation initiation factor SUI1